MRLIKTVIFDVDGTLVDSNNLHVEAWREAFRCYGKELTFDDVHGQMGKGGDQFQAALAGLKGVAPGEAVVVGDTPYDVQAAAKASIRTVGLLSGGFTEAALREAGAVAVYRDVSDLLDNYEESPLAASAAAAAGGQS